VRREGEREVPDKQDYAEDNHHTAENDATHILVIERLAEVLKRNGQMMRFGSDTDHAQSHGSVAGHRLTRHGAAPRERTPDAGVHHTQRFWPCRSMVFESSLPVWSRARTTK
jgi:hypothetical protein